MEKEWKSSTRQDYYKEYIEFEKEIENACNCINAFRCRNLRDEIATIKTTINGLQIQDKWQDSVGDGFATIISANIKSLEDILNSIDSSFTKAESIYEDLKDLLANLKNANNAYQKRYKEKPNSDDYYHNTKVGVNENGEDIYNYQLDHREYHAALDKWNRETKELAAKCEDLITQIEANKKELEAINNEIVSSENVKTLSTINVGSILNFFSLPIDEQKNFILQTFGTTNNPFLSRFAQNQYDDVSIGGGGRTISSSGCGLCAAASALSCALSNEYGSYVSIDPRQLVKTLKDSTGHSTISYFNSNYDYAWNSFDDTTATFKDVSIIKLSSGSGTFSDKTLKQVTDAGGTAVVSLNGRGHLVAVTQSDSNGKFKVADSGSRHYDSKTVNVSDPIYSASKKTSGTISGKNGAIYMPNNRLSIDTNTGVVNGIDATGLKVESISIAGKTYPASVSDGKIVIKNPQELNTVSI